MSTNKETDPVEELQKAKDEAWSAYSKLSGPADAAYKKFQAFSALHKDAVLYAKAKRKVMRDLINQAAKISD